MLVLSEISHLSDSLVLLLEARSAHLHQARALLSALTAGPGAGVRCHGMLLKPVCSPGPFASQLPVFVLNKAW